MRTRTEHPLIGKTVRWTHGPNTLEGPATHYDDEDDELFIVPDGLTHGHYWVPARECAEVRAGVVAEEPEWEREVALHWLEADTVTDRGADESDMREVIRATQDAAEIVERRVTPWVPVKQEAAETDG